MDHEESKEVPENIYFCFIDYAKAFDCVDHNRGKFLKIWKYEITLPVSWEIVCGSSSNIENQTWNNWLAQNWEKNRQRLYIVTLLI